MEVPPRTATPRRVSKFPNSLENPCPEVRRKTTMPIALAIRNSIPVQPDTLVRVRAEE